MTPAILDRLLAIAQQPPLLAPDQLPDALDRLEAAAEARPDDPDVAAAFEVLLRRDEVQRALPDVVAGVRRADLVRWSSWCSTWTGTAVEDGRSVMVRAIDTDASPRRVRQLQREVGQLGLRSHQGATVIDLVGRPLTPPRAADPDLARRLVQGLVALAARPPSPELAPEELRESPEGVHICCMALDDDDGREATAALARALLPPGEGPLHDLLRGLAQHPVGANQAGSLVSQALARELTAMRHHLLARWTANAQGVRTKRLSSCVQRLTNALPPPRGRAAAGINLDGRVLVVASDEATVHFGPEQGMEQVFSLDEGLNAPLARRVLRAQATAPPNPYLSKQIGGDAAFNDAIGRWLASALRLRTLSMLLKKQAG